MNDMSFFTDLIGFVQAAIILIGLATGIVGGIMYGQGQSSDDATKKTTAMNTIIGGIIIALVGFTLVPRLNDYIPTAAIQGISLMARSLF